MSQKIIDKFDLSNKVALVTGGAGMLGKRYVMTLLEANARVVVADLNVDEAQKVAMDESDKTGNEAISVGGDISKKEDVKQIVTSILDKWGRIDILVNNAAIDPKFDKETTSKDKVTFEDYPLELWQQSLDVNLTGTFLCVQEVGKVMVNQGGGVIVNIASTYGLVGPDQRIYKKDSETEQTLFKPVSYCVTKGGILQLTRYLAAYWGDKNIRVNSLTPGGIYTDQDDEFVKKYSSRTPLDRMADKDEMSAALLFLVSDASSYMTGANLVVDGGWTAW